MPIVSSKIIFFLHVHVTHLTRSWFCSPLPARFSYAIDCSIFRHADLILDTVSFTSLGAPSGDAPLTSPTVFIKPAVSCKVIIDTKTGTLSSRSSHHTEQ
jgi:hypothetical protein